MPVCSAPPVYWWASVPAESDGAIHHELIQFGPLGVKLGATSNAVVSLS